ncbi:hypothetical protein StoSoilB22_01400 [Arthrobacter sp. StoSoilB22]|nr:hypothetical protein StoSoilB22_01400 [Arthrobacter sp. StoSoilB22]
MAHTNGAQLFASSSQAGTLFRRARLFFNKCAPFSAVRSRGYGCGWRERVRGRWGWWEPDAEGVRMA